MSDIDRRARTGGTSPSNAEGARPWVRRADAPRIRHGLNTAAASQGRAGARIPLATYRVQLHRGFTFRDAAALVPYLSTLGVTHLYCSPYLRARPFRDGIPCRPPVPGRSGDSSIDTAGAGRDLSWRVLQAVRRIACMASCTRW